SNCSARISGLEKVSASNKQPPRLLFASPFLRRTAEDVLEGCEVINSFVGRVGRRRGYGKGCILSCWLQYLAFS
ncbi:hypothetical protein WG66_004050, partial [Moniliophthora roreri]